jgi:hypothetical protein
MGKTTYSRTPATSKGTQYSIKLPRAQLEILESTTRIPTRLLKPLRDLLSPRLNNTSRTSLLTDAAFLTPSITEALEEPDKLQSSEKHSEDGPRNQSRLYLDWSITSRPTPTLRTLRTLPLITFKSIELPKEEDVPIELMVVLAHISHLKPMFKSSPLKRLLMLKRKEKLDKLPKERSLSDNNDGSI